MIKWLNLIFSIQQRTSSDDNLWVTFSRMIKKMQAVLFDYFFGQVLADRNGLNAPKVLNTRYINKVVWQRTFFPNSLFFTNMYGLVNSFSLMFENRMHSASWSLIQVNSEFWLLPRSLCIDSLQPYPMLHGKKVKISQIPNFMVNVLKFHTFLFRFSDKMLVISLYQGSNSQCDCPNSKQVRPWSDCFFRSSLIWVCTVLTGN